MTTLEHLMTLATAYAEAAVRADRERKTARSAVGLTEQADALTAVRHADETIERTRDALHIHLRQALEHLVRAIPDTELPVFLRRDNQVEIRALTDAEDRSVRVRYTPAQALTAGTALIACAALADQRLGGTLSTILGAFPADTDMTAGAGSAWFGSPA